MVSAKVKKRIQHYQKKALWPLFILLILSLLFVYFKGVLPDEKQVKIGLALEAVAAAEHIEASEDEINAEIKRIADQYKMEEDKVRELINLEDLKQDLARTKAIDFIKSHANIVEKPAEAEKAADAE